MLAQQQGRPFGRHVEARRGIASQDRVDGRATHWDLKMRIGYTLHGSQGAGQLQETIAVNIVRCDRELETPHVDRTLRGWGHALTLLPEVIGEDDLCAAMAPCDVLLMCYTPITARVIAAAPRLRGIVKYGVGVDAIDIPAAHARGIAVVNIPTYAEETVAEGAFAMLIALAKKLPALQQAMRREGWVWPTARWLSSDLAGKTVGIVGCGKIGARLARMAGDGFRARVLGYDPHKSPDELRSLGVEPYHDLHAMLAVCDFVSLHVALSDATRHLIGAAELAAMKRTAILINTARGALVEEAALLHALKTGQIAGAGLDVFSREPLNQTDHPLRELYSLDNVILSPHLAFYTAEAMERLESETLERCREIFDGRPVTIRSTDARLQRPSVE
jgi:D-3-phosphoglycerate dehydrogenase